VLLCYCVTVLLCFCVSVCLCVCTPACPCGCFCACVPSIGACSPSPPPHPPARSGPDEPGEDALDSKGWQAPCEVRIDHLHRQLQGVLDIARNAAKWTHVEAHRAARSVQVPVVPTRDAWRGTGVWWTCVAAGAPGDRPCACGWGSQAALCRGFGPFYLQPSRPLRCAQKLPSPLSAADAPHPHPSPAPRCPTPSACTAASWRDACTPPA
jgi:hypothetical protein